MLFTFSTEVTEGLKEASKLTEKAKHPRPRLAGQTETSTPARVHYLTCAESMTSEDCNILSYYTFEDHIAVCVNSIEL